MSRVATAPQATSSTPANKHQTLSVVTSPTSPQRPRAHTYSGPLPSPQSPGPRRFRRDSSFLERLLSDPILQTMADIGKQEGVFVTPLPVNTSPPNQYHHQHNQQHASNKEHRRVPSLTMAGVPTMVRRMESA